MQLIHNICLRSRTLCRIPWKCFSTTTEFKVCQLPKATAQLSCIKYSEDVRARNLNNKACDEKHLAGLNSATNLQFNQKNKEHNVLKTPLLYASLSKWYLTWFVVMTTDAGFCLAPVTFDHSTFFFVTIGTALCSCAANTLNQIAEVPYDAQMDRTKGRPLVKAVISPMHAFLFSVFSGTTGALCLYYGTNTVTTILGVSNILLYAGIYTSLKRKHWSNTWVGAVVGAIPPVMGWTAATGSLD
uniref:Protoheme IX farnesyltransferase, mitochondrial n=1 Tax=Ciona intestinalis TaxID=7719 RepID=F6ULH6_CIOIN